MSISRKKFLVNSGLLIAGSTLLSRKLFAMNAAPNELMGLQLYTVRDDIKKDPKGVLKQLSDIGYKYVEHANYVDRKFYGYTATDFKKILDDLGLQMKSGHTKMGKEHWDTAKNDFSDSWKYTVEDAATVGQMYVISPWLDEGLRKSYDDLLQFLSLFNKSGELCKKSGMKFGYHNHDFEFRTTVNGMQLYDIIMKNTDPSLVAQQLDIGNLYGTGALAGDIIKKYPGRFELLHVKDEIPSTKGEMEAKFESTILGKGVIGTKEITDLARLTGGTKHFIIEQESYQGKTPIDCSREDFAVMKSWGY